LVKCLSFKLFWGFSRSVQNSSFGNYFIEPFIEM
jgi:hypothetical protein